MNIIESLKLEIAVYPGARLIAVSKTKPGSAIADLYDKGQREFAENRVQELEEKVKDLPSDIQWHLIGSLQKNKVKFIAPYIAMIHSVDSLELAQMIDKEASKNQRRIPILLQIRIANEETKQGFEIEEVEALLRNGDLQMFKNIEIKGLMGMASFTDNQQQVRQEFKLLRSYFDNFKRIFFSNDPHFHELSMGMSSDYQIALEEGSTMVRIGSLLFGSRS